MLLTEPRVLGRPRWNVRRSKNTSRKKREVLAECRANAKSVPASRGLAEIVDKNDAESLSAVHFVRNDQLGGSPEV